MVIVKAIYANSEEVLTVTVDVSGTKTSDTYRYNTPVTIKITDDQIPEGKVFVGWLPDNGTSIVSYDKEYKFYAYKDITLTAVFAEAEVNSDASVIIDTVVKREDESNFKAEIMITRYLPKDFVFVSSGALITKKTMFANEDGLTFEKQSENPSEIKLFRTIQNTNNGQYKITVNTSTDNTVYARGFVVYLDKTTGAVVTVYTDITEISVK